jgi:hypothetical protein
MSSELEINKWTMNPGTISGTISNPVHMTYEEQAELGIGTVPNSFKDDRPPSCIRKCQRIDLLKK